MLDELHDVVAGRLAAVDQRYTEGRRQLVELLAAAARPVSIPDILAAHRALPKSTVYRNLTVLEAAGAVRRVTGGDDHGRYELAEDLTEHHHHLVCTACGSVADFTAPERLERTVARVIAEVTAGTGFRPDSHRLDLVGRCADCT